MSALSDVICVCGHDADEHGAPHVGYCGYDWCGCRAFAPVDQDDGADRVSAPEPHDPVTVVAGDLMLVLHHLGKALDGAGIDYVDFPALDEWDRLNAALEGRTSAHDGEVIR